MRRPYRFGSCTSTDLFRPGKRLGGYEAMWGAGVSRGAVTVLYDLRSNVGSFLWHASRSGHRRRSSAVLESRREYMIHTHAVSSKLGSYQTHRRSWVKSSIQYNPQREGHWMSYCKKVNHAVCLYVVLYNVLKGKYRGEQHVVSQRVPVENMQRWGQWLTWRVKARG